MELYKNAEDLMDEPSRHGEISPEQEARLDRCWDAAYEKMVRLGVANLIKTLIALLLSCGLTLGQEPRDPQAINTELVGHMKALQGFFTRYPEFRYEAHLTNEMLLLWQYPFPSEAATSEAYRRRDLWLEMNKR